MRDLTILSKIKGKRLDRFCEIINHIRPGTEVNERKAEWKAIRDNSHRSTLINSFLNMKGFSDTQIRAIEKYVYKIIIPWKPLLLSLPIIFLGFVIYEVYLFSKIPLVYTYGNNVAVYTQPNTLSVKTDQMDIFGQRFTAESNKPKKSTNKMLMTDSSRDFVRVKKNNFFNWLFTISPAGYIKKEELIFTKKEYNQYGEIFSSIKGDSNLVNLDMKSRKVIFDLINNDKTLNGSVLSNDYPEKVSKAGCSKILSIPVADITYIFLRIKTPVSTRNIVISYGGTGMGVVKDLIENNSQNLNVIGLFKKDAGDIPDIILYDLDKKKEWKSINPPYNIFNK